MYSKFVSVLVLVVLLFVMCAGVVDAGEPAYSGTEPGKGEGGPVGEDKWNNDPDDTPNGPDRGDGTVDAVDWNNGCGNEVDRTDDNEGLCRGGSLPPAPVVVKPINRKVRTCNLVLIDETPELFSAELDVRDPASEEFVIAESHGWLKVTLPWGFDGKVLWYRDQAGHGASPWQKFTCNQDEITLWEPMGLWGGTFE